MTRKLLAKSSYEMERSECLLESLNGTSEAGEGPSYLEMNVAVFQL